MKFTDQGHRSDSSIEKDREDNSPVKWEVKKPVLYTHGEMPKLNTDRRALQKKVYLWDKDHLLTQGRHQNTFQSIENN